MAVRGQTVLDDIDLSGLPQSTQAKALRYWFDDDDGSVKTVNNLSGQYSLDVSGLIEGLHTLHYQVIDNEDKVAYISSTVFMNMGAKESSSVQSLRYWFDDDNASVKTIESTGIYTLDVSELIDGLHTIHYQVKGSDGMASYIASSLFFKTGNSLGPETDKASKLMYWFDDETAVQNVDMVQGVQMLDVSGLTEGLHTLHYQVLCNNGQITPAMSSLFMRMSSDVETAVAKSLRYWFDDDATTMATTSVAGGTQTLDVSSIPVGLHTLNYQLIDCDGKVGIPMTGIFFKTFDKVLAEGKNRVTKYQYWLNTNSVVMQTVELASAANPYTLIALLPMQKEPIQSSQFHFEMTNDVPTIYAKNTLHVRFFDAQNYFSDESKLFLDYSVKQEVEPVGELQKTQTFPKVAENDIRWYTMQSAPGDTAAFRMSQPATLQVFAPSGKEVFNTSESTSVQWGGIHTWEDGTYYVAVHDVTGSKSNMTLDYMHMDKYDVVEWDVHTVGNGGCSTITFKGNGFRDLYRVDLYTAAGDSIHSVDISHDSDAETAVTFDFSGAELGVYNAVFHFTQEDKRFTNIVTVEEAVDIELVTNVTFPSTFLRGTSTTYTIKITNKGNMTAYAVPIYTYIMNKINKDGVKHIEYEGLDLPSMFDGVDMESWPEQTKMELKRLSKSLGDAYNFVLMHMENEDSPNDSIWVRTGYFFTNISPHATKTLHLTITSDETVWTYITIPENWLAVGDVDSNISENRSRVSKRAKMGDYYCCFKTKLECYIERVAAGCDIASPILAIIGVVQPQLFEVMEPAALAVDIFGCYTAMANDKLKHFGKVFCESDKRGIEDFLNSLHDSASRGGASPGTIFSCIGAILSGIGATVECIKACLSEGAYYIGNGALAFDFGPNTSCSQMGYRQPNCPPNPGGGGSSTPVNSCEPNDMLGYTAESGSKAIKDGVTDIYYTIQFENDTVFADAPAHDIYLTDTLDVNLFDLSTYRPTKITIGNKSMELTGERNFISTLDMRPEINAIAQIEGTIDDKTGIVRWHISSLHPMTMEPSDDPMVGVLPVNFDGSGLGEASYDISLKKNLPHGTVIPNRSGNIFDSNETVMTPTWTNVIDRIAPESHVTDVKMLNDSTATVSIEATDELSGPWRYNVYVQYGDGAWFLGAENVPIDTTASVKVYEGINHGFYVVVTDSAGNVEQKNAEREFTLEVFGSQVDTNTQLALAEGWNWVSHNQNEALALDELKPKAQRILSQTEELYKDARFGWSGDLEELSPTQMYKVQMAEVANIQLSGKLFNAGFRSIPLYAGWNWLGYPVANAMTVAEALEKLEAEEGDFIIGQDGMATYSEDQWTGTLIELQPGKGYMYRSTSDKNLFYNATAQVSSHPVAKRAAAENWTVETRKYPNVMALVANLIQNGSVADADEWLVAAFCGDECRGVAQTVNGVLMMNIYGTGSEPISFYAMNRETEELMMATEAENFRTDVLGSMQQPYELHIGETTGVKDTSKELMMDGSDVYDLQGRQISGKLSSINARLKKGIYIVTDSKRTKTQKVVR